MKIITTMQFFKVYLSLTQKGVNSSCYHTYKEVKFRKIKFCNYDFYYTFLFYYLILKYFTMSICLEATSAYILIRETTLDC